MKNLNRLYPHLLVIFGFIVISLMYFYPVLQGKKMYQSDIAQYTGMAKEQNDFRQQENQEPYWTNSAFGGMPTYQLGAKYPHNYIKAVDEALRFLPRPADYLFLYFIGFYILLCSLKIDPLKAFFGALAFGFSTYLIIILGAGHNAKAHAIAYMPAVVAGVVLVFKKRYVAGGLLTMIAAALEINANHFQMTYYLLLLLLVIGIYFLVQIIKSKDFKHLGITLSVFAIGGILAVGVNATNIMATSEYAKYSIRSKGDLSYNPDGSQNTTTSSMEYDYISEYSYGVTESLNLIFPRLFGGGNGENVGTDSVMGEFVTGQGATPAEAAEFTANVPTYWGDQPIVEAPAYIGAIVFFLAVLALFIDKRKIKYAFLAGAILSLLLSWGKNFEPLTVFFIDFIPMYDKFRAVSSIQVILELCMPVLAFMGIQVFLQSDKDSQWKALWQSGAVVLGLAVLLFLFKGSFDFAGMRDADYREAYGQMGQVFVDALKEQRQEMYSNDLLRSTIFVLLAAGALWLVLKNRLSQTYGVILVGVLLVADLYLIDRNYVNAENFISARQVDVPFEPSQADLHILNDKSDFRVYSLQGRLQAKTNYFHKSVGGYSAVRPRKADQLFTYQVEPKVSEIAGGINQQTLALGKSIPALDMMNVKYILFPAEEGEVPVTNPYANGGAWFVGKVKEVKTADDEMKAIGNLDSKNEAIVNTANFPDAVKQKIFTVDSTAAIKSEVDKPNYLKYTSTNANAGLAVFSQVYYANGWNAFIDGKPAQHFEADYLLRAMQIPAGKHIIEFKFEPQVIKTGSSIALFSTIGMVMLLGGASFMEYRKRNRKQIAA